MLFVVKDCLSSEYPVILSAIPGVHSPVHQANNATSMRSMLDLTRLYEEGEDVDANIALKRILAIADMLAAYRLPLSIPVAHFKFEPMSSTALTVKSYNFLLSPRRSQMGHEKHPTPIPPEARWEVRRIDRGSCTQRERVIVLPV